MVQQQIINIKWLRLVVVIFSRLLFSIVILVSMPSYSFERILTPEAISGRDITIDEAIPADVLARILLAEKELDLLILEFGKPKIKTLEIEVTNVSSRQVYFQALTLFKKTNRLAYELTGQSKAVPNAPNRKIYPVDAWHVVDKALLQLLVVKNKLGIIEGIKEDLPDTRATSTDAYYALMRVISKINTLISKKISPSDVYKNITLALNYTASLLALYPDTVIAPKTVPFVHKKTSGDVYKSLTKSYQLIWDMTKNTELEGLTLSVSHTASRKVTPSDVLVLSALIISELDYLHKQLNFKLSSKSNVRESYFPGFKLPSHVFQRVEMLNAQLEKLKNKMDKELN